MKSTQLKLLIALLIMAIAVTACNLSAGASQTIVPSEATIIVTATASPTTQALTSQTSTSTIQTQNTSSSSTTNNSSSSQSSSSSSAVSSSTSNKVDNLYYVNGGKPTTVLCAVQAQVNTNIRNARSTSSSIIGQLIGGGWIGISNHNSGWYQIDAPNTPVDRLFINDEPTELDTGCHCNNSGCTRTQLAVTPTLDQSIHNVIQPFPVPQSVCAIYPAGDFSVNIRDGQSESSKILGRLAQGSWVQVRHLVNGWFGIVRPGTAVDGAYIAAGPAQLISHCSCTDTSCNLTQAIQDCILYGDERVKVFTEPGNWSPIVGQLVAGTPYRATVQSTNGWYNLEIGGWVMQSFMQFPVGSSCQQLPVITYNPPVLTCKLKNTSGEIQPILREPDGEYFGRFGINLELGIISRDENWFHVYVDAFSNAGWVDGTNMEVTGDCISQ